MKEAWFLTVAALTLACLGAGVSSQAASVTYAYDTLGRLIEATYDNGTDIVYSYDQAGNRTSQAVFSSGAGSGNTPLSAFNRTDCQYYPTADGGLSVSCSSAAGTYSGTYPSGPAELDLADGTLYAADEAHAAIARVYVAVLNRMGTPDNLNFYYSACYSPLPAIAQANPAAGLVTASSECGGGVVGYFLASPENQLSTTLDTPAEQTNFVKTLYTRVLNRGASDDEVSFYIKALAGGASAAQVVADISTSPEAVTHNQYSVANGVASGWLIPESAPQI